MNFWKYQVNGNDFILTEDSDVDVVSICDRHYGVGADGVLVVELIDKHCVCQYYNADGSYAEFCGNGICCVANWYMQIFHEDVCQIQMGDTLYDVYKDKDEIVVKVHCPQMLGPNLYKCGVIHVVADESIQDDTYNVNFCEILDRNTIRVQTFEKGVGWTLSCGSGSIVSFYHYFIHDEIENMVDCICEGGKSRIWIEDTFIYYAVMADDVFSGEIEMHSYLG